MYSLHGESVLLNIPGVEPHYLLVVDRRGNLDELEVYVEVSESVFMMKKKMERLTANRQGTGKPVLLSGFAW